MATGTTINYSLPYPLSTDPVRVSGDIEQLATKIDNDLQEIVEDRASAMWTGGTFSNGLNTPTYNDSTGKMSMSLSQDLRSTASPTFSGLNINGSSIVFEGSSADDFETTFTITNPTADRTITFQNGSGTVPFASDVHFIGTTSIALNRASAAQSLTGITSIDGSAATLTTGRTIGMTGDVTWTSASFNGSANVTGTSTISNDAVTYAKMQNVSAQYRVLGRISASAGDPEELTPDNMVTLINQASTAIAATEGGTGQTSYAVGDILYASSASALSKLAGVATGNALISGGVGIAPSWGKIGLTTHISGTLAVANGGTGVTTSTGSGSVVLSGSPSFSGNLTIRNADSFAVPFAYGSKYGFSSSYRVLVLGDNNTTNATTISLGYDPISNTNSSFTGDGREVLFRNSVEFMTPNSANNGYLKPMQFTSAGSVQLNNIPTAPTASVDTNTTQIATTAYVINQGYLKSATAISTYAPLASPALTGTPTSPTAAVDTNTTQIATTAYVIGQGYLKSSTAITTYQPLDEDLTSIAGLTGTTGFLKKTAANTWTLDTAAYTTNTGTVTSIGVSVPTGLSVSNSPITTSGTIAISLASGYIIPTTTSLDAKAPLASPTFTGTPAAPTASPGTNTTQIATTAYVQQAIGTVGSLPSQTGNNGKYLTTDGTTASWTDIVDCGTP